MVTQIYVEKQRGPEKLTICVNIKQYAVTQKRANTQTHLHIFSSFPP